MSDHLYSFETILVLLKQVEATSLGLRQLRSYVGKGVAAGMVEVLIEEGDATIALVKRTLML